MVQHLLDFMSKGNEGVGGDLLFYDHRSLNSSLI